MSSFSTEGVVNTEMQFFKFKPTTKFYISESASSFFNVNESDFENTTSTEYSPHDEELFHSDIGIFTIALFVTLSVVVLVIGLVGNCLVWFAVWRNPRMRSATNIFLVNLAVADFLVILICLPPTMTEDVTGIWYLGKEMCKIVKCLQKVSVLVSVLTLTAISIERWLAICRPLMFRQTSVRAKRAIAIVWTLSLASAVPDAISLDLIPVSQHPSESALFCVPSWPEDVETIHLWIIFIVFYIVPLCIMTFTYVKVALCLWQSGLIDDNDEASANVPRAQILLRRKKAKMLIVVVAMFGICYLPVYVFFLFRYTDTLDLFPEESIKPFILCSHWLCYFNSAINPAIYNFMSCNFRREFRIACHICCRRGTHHNTIYEALRMRTFNKHRFRKDRTSGPTGNENSCSLQTQITGLGASASSYTSLAPPYNSDIVTTPLTRYRNGLVGLGSGEDDRSSLQERLSPISKQQIRFTVLKGHKDTTNCKQGCIN